MVDVKSLGTHSIVGRMSSCYVLIGVTELKKNEVGWLSGENVSRPNVKPGLGVHVWNLRAVDRQEACRRTSGGSRASLEYETVSQITWEVRADSGGCAVTSTHPHRTCTPPSLV